MIRFYVYDGVQLFQESCKELEIRIFKLYDTCCTLDKSYYTQDFGNCVHYCKT